MLIGLNSDHQRDRYIRHIDMNVLFFVVVEEMELLGLETAHVLPVAVEDQHRSHYNIDRGADRGELRSGLRGWLRRGLGRGLRGCLLLRRQASRKKAY